MNDAITRIRATAREAMAEYHTDVVNGGEPIFPQWAKDWQGVLDTLDETQRQNAALAEDYKDLEANATANATNPKRYGLGIARSGGIGVPAIVEMENGEYVQARFYDACVAHNEMLVERLRLADAKVAGANRKDNNSVLVGFAVVDGQPQQDADKADARATPLSTETTDADALRAFDAAIKDGYLYECESYCAGYVDAQPDPAMAGDEWMVKLGGLLGNYAEAVKFDNPADIENAANAIHAHARKRVQPASGEDARETRVSGFIAGFICAGGDADEARRQAPQFQACIDAARPAQP